MKRFHIIILAAAAVLGTAPAHAQNEPQITNGDFEQWTIDGANLPNYFNSFQTADGNQTYKNYAYDSNNRQVGRSSETRPGSNGKYSCSIWARSFKVALFFTVTAQGNLTTGRVHCGSTSATAQENHNYSDRGDYVTFGSFNNPCAMPFTGRPDSLVVWIKYKPDSQSTHAKISTILHDDSSYQDYYGKNHNQDSHAIGTAINNDIISTGNQWKRISIPFSYRSSSNPSYILFSAATSNTPGEGGAYDNMLIDDIELIYNHSFNLTVPSQGWASMFLDFNAAVPAGVKVYYAKELVAGYAKLQEIPAGSVIPKNTGVIVKAAPGTVTFKSSSATPATVAGNILSGSTSASSKASGTKYYVLSPASTSERAVFGLYQGSTLAANKAYIAVR